MFHNDDADKRAESAHKEVMKQFKVHTEEFGVDMRWVLECGHCRHSCDKIPLEGFIGEERSVFALTMNAKLVLASFVQLNTLELLSASSTTLVLST